MSNEFSLREVAGYLKSLYELLDVIPAKAGIQFLALFFWIPACAGMTY